MRRHLLFLTAILTISSPAADVVGGTGVLRWKDGKDAVFLLAFDDSCVSHLEHAIPELEKRGLVGNFYIVPGKGALPPKKEAWQKVASSPAVALQNHTFTHAGATTVDQLDDELARCNQAIRQLLPDRKWPRLIAFGYPGGVPWTVPRDQLLKSLEKHHLIERPAREAMRRYGVPFSRRGRALPRREGDEPAFRPAPAVAAPEA